MLEQSQTFRGTAQTEIAEVPANAFLQDVTMPVRSKEQDQLTNAVIIATCKVREAQIELDVAKKRDTRKCWARLKQAREEEWRALEALDLHQRKASMLSRERFMPDGVENSRPRTQTLGVQLL
jgi:hypothetical protein